jgi:signal transduction histidine kinase
MDIDVLLKREQLAKNICAQLNNFVDLKSTLSLITSQLKELADVEAISIRLHENGDYPYFVHEGFSNFFINHENSILSQNKGAHTPSLDCMCGKVISGEINKQNEYTSLKGSYYTNNSTDTAKLLLKEEYDTDIRNYCNTCGYQSVGLFPIKTRNENIGLIQLNDKKKDIFNPDLVEFIEMIGEQIGVAVENALLYEKLKNKNSELENSLNNLSDMQGQLLEAKKMSTLADMVSGMAHELYSPITKALNSTAESLKIAYDLAEKDTGYANQINSLSVESKQALKNIEEVQSLILSFKAIAIDQFQESRQLINLKTFIQNVINVLKPSYKEIDVSYKINCRDTIEFMSYSGALSQVLNQLLNNSLQHGFKGRSAGEISINCTVSHSGFIEIVYSDNGIGLEPGTKHKIFEPFFSTQKKRNSGLGLAIAKDLMGNKLNGQIEVDTSTDEGVEFRLKVPY